MNGIAHDLGVTLAELTAQAAIYERVRSNSCILTAADRIGDMLL
jgi:hypothetical protein